MSSDVSTIVGGTPAKDVNSVKNTLKVAIVLCLACSVLVSVFAVGLKSIQDSKKLAFKQENILKAAGLWEDGMDPAAEFESRVQALLFDFETGEAIDDSKAIGKIDVRRDSKKPDKSDAIENDIANIKRREKQTVVYKLSADGRDILVLPVRGYGLWSTLWGFIALDMTDASDGPDKITVAGLTFYDQKETPGLGGEVDNPNWKQKWIGKKVFDASWDVKAKVTKGAEGLYQVDALSGATITSSGVSNMLAYWLGDEGFGSYVKDSVGGTAVAAPEGENSEDGEQK